MNYNCITFEKEDEILFTISIKISYVRKRNSCCHLWCSSISESLVDLQEGQLMLLYCYVSNSNKHVNKKDEERMII